MARNSCATREKSVTDGESCGRSVGVSLILIDLELKVFAVEVFAGMTDVNRPRTK
jgi:hypothetical protein